jgi:hypothetical protein
MIIIMGYECVWGLSGGGINRRREGAKERVLRGEADQSTLHVYEDGIMKPTKHCLKKKGRKNIMGVNLFKVCCTYVYYHNEMPSYY